ncbi:hypothetical protein ACLOJK_035067 [Asimina triloba]
MSKTARARPVCTRSLQHEARCSITSKRGWQPWLPPLPPVTPSPDAIATARARRSAAAAIGDTTGRRRRRRRPTNDAVEGKLATARTHHGRAPRKAIQAIHHDGNDEHILDPSRPQADVDHSGHTRQIFLTRLNQMIQAVYPAALACTTPLHTRHELLQVDETTPASFGQPPITRSGPPITMSLVPTADADVSANACIRRKAAATMMSSICFAARRDSVRCHVFTAHPQMPLPPRPTASACQLLARKLSSPARCQCWQRR